LWQSFLAWFVVLSLLKCLWPSATHVQERSPAPERRVEYHEPPPEAIPTTVPTTEAEIEQAFARSDVLTRAEEERLRRLVGPLIDRLRRAALGEPDRADALHHADTLAQIVLSPRGSSSWCHQARAWFRRAESRAVLDELETAFVTHEQRVAAIAAWRNRLLEAMDGVGQRAAPAVEPELPSTIHDAP